MQVASEIEFLAEIKEVKAKKVVSGDVIYRLVVESDNPMLHSLGLIGGDTLVRVTVAIDND